MRRRGLPRKRRLKSVIAAAAGAVLLASTGCAGADSGVPNLTWYVNSDDGGQAKLARDCTAAADGKYKITSVLLPKQAQDQREQLVRRLASHDKSIDMMSLDPIYISELANADYLAPVPDHYKDTFTKNAFDSSVESATSDGTLVAAPFWSNTQLLWYRKSVAKAAGLDMSKPVTWDQIIDAAHKEKKTVSVQALKSEQLSVWLNALVESGGGHLVDNPDASSPEKVKLGLDSAAGRKAAHIMQRFGKTKVGGPQLSNLDETSSMTQFQKTNGGFMVNWPFVYAATAAGVKDGTIDKSVLDDMGWTLYPRTDANKESKPPLGGINLAVSKFSTHQSAAFKAIECLRQPKNQASYFLSDGNPPATTTAFKDPDVRKNFPAAPMVEKSLKRAAPRPLTPYYNEVTGSVQKTWHPPGSVDPKSTPRTSQELMYKVLLGERLL